MTMHWKTYLVRLYPDVNRMDAWEERMRRTQLITSKHLHRFITALLAPFDLRPDWGNAPEWCAHSLWSVTSVPVTSI